MRPLVLETRGDWTTCRLNKGGLHRREWYGLSIASDFIPAVGLVSHRWSTDSGSSADWPWVQGKHMTGGMYSPSEGRIIPFSRPEVWYQIALPTWMLDPIHPERISPLPARAVQLD